MRITLFFVVNPGPYQIDRITYRIEGLDSIEALDTALRQAAKITTVPIAATTIEGMDDDERRIDDGDEQLHEVETRRR